MIDIIGIRPPCDLAVVRFRERKPPERILVATKGGPHAPLALELAQRQAEIYQKDSGRPSLVTILTVLKPDANGRETHQAQTRLEKLVQNYQGQIEIKVVLKNDEYAAIMEEANASDLVIVHAPAAGLLEQRLFGSIPQRLAKECDQTVIMVKGHNPMQTSIMRWLGIQRNALRESGKR